jgi:prenyl protein peptidase
MATPAGLHPASPPAIPGATAVAACASMAVSYVAVLYAPTVILRLPPPTSLRAFLHRRFACAAVASTASALATAALLRVSSPSLIPPKLLSKYWLWINGQNLKSLIFLYSSPFASQVWSLGDFADMLAVFGIRKDHLVSEL